MGTYKGTQTLFNYFQPKAGEVMVEFYFYTFPHLHTPDKINR